MCVRASRSSGECARDPGGDVTVGEIIRRVPLTGAHPFFLPLSSRARTRPRVRTVSHTHTRSTCVRRRLAIFKIEKKKKNIFFFLFFQPSSITKSYEGHRPSRFTTRYRRVDQINVISSRATIVVVYFLSTCVRVCGA